MLDAVEGFLLDAVGSEFLLVLINNLKVEQSNTWAHNQVMYINKVIHLMASGAKHRSIATKGCCCLDEDRGVFTSKIT